ncbi:hypothetical protein MSAN_02429400 [Mycena sanguinolenta]|uniref:Uncharacterized protein n=1 Tax=Mycena sanguinolenta TaxID=230812 RepID=A0A8H7CE65_9AGAR|nr:hypothetical protein MSAN_02429400 [Mycena sanguinolenta]
MRVETSGRGGAQYEDVDKSTGAHRGARREVPGGVYMILRRQRRERNGPVGELARDDADGAHCYRQHSASIDHFSPCTCGTPASITPHDIRLRAVPLLLRLPPPPLTSTFAFSTSTDIIGSSTSAPAPAISMSTSVAAADIRFHASRSTFTSTSDHTLIRTQDPSSCRLTYATRNRHTPLFVLVGRGTPGCGGGGCGDISPRHRGDYERSRR